MDATNSRTAQGEPAAKTRRGTLVYRQSIWTRITHWLWAICLFFLLLTGLQIFNSHPALYIGDQSGFQFDNSVLRIGAINTPEGQRGYTEILGRRFDTTGVLGSSGEPLQPQAFPDWLTIPTYHDLGTGRVIHFFFAWVLSATLLVWLVASLVNGHAWRDLVPKPRDIRKLPRDFLDHLKFRFRHAREYNVLQKLAYAGVLFVLLPLMIATGLAMSPSANAMMPWLPEILGGRQTARTIHFVVMLLLVGFFAIHILMVVAAGPINELRSIITGWYRIDAADDGQVEKKP